MDYKTHSPPIWEENGGASYRPNVAYLAHGGREGARSVWWSGVTGGRSRVATVGSQQQQEWEDAAGPGLGGGVPQWCEAREAGAESPVQHTIVVGSTGTLGEDLRRPYMPPSRDWCVPPLTLTWANSTAGSPVNVVLQLLPNYNSQHAWTRWDDGS